MKPSSPILQNFPDSATTQSIGSISLDIDNGDILDFFINDIERLKYTFPSATRQVLIIQPSGKKKKEFC